MNEIDFFKLVAQQLEIISARACADIAKAPEGSLNITYINGRPQYRHKRSAVSVVYLAKSELTTARRLAQKGYARTVLAEANRELKVIHRLSSDLAAYESLCDSGSTLVCEGIGASRLLGNEFAVYPGLSKIESIYEALPEARRNLVEPYVVPLKDYVEQWEADKVEAGSIYGGGLRLQTEKGEIVRSKSEVIIADKLFRAGIPYKYEQPFQTREGTLYPDFVVLQTLTRKEILWEHFGLMDNVEYCNRCMKKLNAYASEGLFPGKGLITTFETSSIPLNTQQIDRIIELIQSDYLPFSSK